MSIDMSQFYQVFFEETAEHLANMENLLLNIDIGNPDLEELNAIFRAAHSIKGGAGTFGFTDMAEVTHVLETLLDRLRKQELAPTDEMIDAFLKAGDVLKMQLAAHQDEGDVDEVQVVEVCELLDRLASGEASAEVVASTPDETTSAVEPAVSGHRWLITFRPDETFSADAEALEALFTDLAAMGTLERLSDGSDGCHRLALTGELGAEAIADTFAFVCEPEQVSITPDDGLAPATTAAEADDDAFGVFDGAPGSEHIGEDEQGFGFFDDAPGSERLAEQAHDQEDDGFGLFGGSPGMEQVAEVAEQERAEQAQGYGFFDGAAGTPAAADSPAAPAAAGGSKPPASRTPARAVPGGGGSSGGNGNKKPAAAAAESSIRVSVEKVDQLINLVGELVITHAMLAQSAEVLDPVTNERIFNGLSNLERNSRDLQQAVMSIRMMPISFVFSRFPRVVRDTAANLKKKVELKLIGEDTELDKGLIEKLADPLNHLVRNSIDHGIESPEQRRAAGKPEKGEIILRASHQGGNIVIEISDDGAGLNREKLLAKAAERGIPMAENPSDKEVWQLIFAAGFSTAEKVTDISGRGVGMDVVRRNIEEMNGRVEIESEPGRGTRILIRLPLTLAILDGMSVRVGDEIFIAPLTAILESIQPQTEQLKTVSGKGRVVHVRGEYLPLVVLHEVFHIDARCTRPEEGIVVILESNEGKAALMVDELVAQHQVVIKSLESNYRKIEGVSGATIMGDGRVALILDIDALVRLSQKGA